MTYRGPRWSTASSEQKVLLLSGVSSRYWIPNSNPPRFKGVSIPITKGRDLSITEQKQRHAYSELQNYQDTLISAGLIAIGSNNGDHNAMHAAVDLIRDLLLSDTPNSPTVHIIDHGHIPSLGDTDSHGRNIGVPWWNKAEEAAVMLHHNILEDADISRVQKLRDILVRFSEATHIVVVCGAAYDFMAYRVGMLPDVLFHVDGIERSSR